MSAAVEPAPTTRGRAAQLRLPGSVAEVDASPEGPEVGAFFDLDGTLVAGFTLNVHTSERLRRREVGAAEFFRMLQMTLDYQLGRSDFETLVDAGARSAKGRLLDDLDEVGERIFQQHIADLLYPEMRELVRAHQRRGHTVVLSSSAMAMQVEPVARYLGIDNVLCNQFVVDAEGVLTGEVARPVLWGPGKANAAQRFASARGVDLQRSYFYADGDEDVALMYLVGHPRPTNPGKRLAQLADRRGWPVLRFTSRGAKGPWQNPRALLGLGALLPVTWGAVSLGLLTRSKRKGLNFVTGNWPSALLAINGVRLEVTGEENLTAQRPAVFIFNHRSNADIFITSALIKNDFTGIAKKELERDPVFGRLGKLLDAAFVDRADSSAAVLALAPIEDLARRGLSILVSPEGTRLDTVEVGPFKKGAFRIAMSAGIPVVPIVIHNAESVAGRNATVFNPGTVHVTVLPPISVADWSLAKLPEHIADVRQRYLDTLAGRPPGALAAAQPGG